jgi:hypothetical protein
VVLAEIDKQGLGIRSVLQHTKLSSASVAQITAACVLTGERS